MLRHEEQVWAQGGRRVAGVDEAGRGPLAGPVVAAAVVFDPEALANGIPEELVGLTDSKKLSATLREHFFGRLRAFPRVQIGVGVGDLREIASINILRATHLAMARAVQSLDPPPDFALVDGMPVRGLPVDHRAIVGGDGQSLSIAAASVIAKVTRDRLMLELAKQYPAYGFDRHKGYGTAEHLAALRRHGPCPAHRKTFGPVAQLLLEF
jgi:ribonuclease HII